MNSWWELLYNFRCRSEVLEKDEALGKNEAAMAASLCLHQKYASVSVHLSASKGEASSFLPPNPHTYDSRICPAVR